MRIKPTRWLEIALGQETGCTSYPIFFPASALFSLLLSQGFGFLEPFKLIVGLCFGFILFSVIQSREIIPIVATIFAFLFSLFWYPLVYLHGYWIIVLKIAGKDSKAIPHAIPSAFAVVWILQEFPIGNFTYLPHLAVPFFLIVCWILQRINSAVYILLAIICVLGTTWELMNSLFAAGESGSIFCRIVWPHAERGLFWRRRAGCSACLELD